MLHGPAAPTGKDPASPYKMRLGAWMFIAYALVYAGFVAINLIDPTRMEHTVLLGLNLAVVYGFFLIIFALVLAMVYSRMCRLKEVELAAADTEKKE